MTAETSNARGETYTFDMIEDAWGDAVPLTKPYFNRFRARLETLRQSAAPPPAAEGVQAGEVSAEDVAVLHRIKAALPDVGVNGWYEGVQALDRVLSSLSQQPAAVDEAMVERACVAFCESAGSARQGIRAALTAALAAQHQEPTT